MWNWNPILALTFGCNLTSFVSKPFCYVELDFGRFGCCFVCFKNLLYELAKRKVPIRVELTKKVCNGWFYGT